MLDALVQVRPQPDAIEERRIKALQRYNILDTGREESFDRISRLAKLALNASGVMVSLLTTDRHWVKSSDGVDVDEVPYEHSMCRHVIRQGGPVVVQDCLLDPRFNGSPYVTGNPGVRFYMGVPLRSNDGEAIGTICAIDDRPRVPSDAQVSVMQDLAKMVTDELELRLVATTDFLTGALTRRTFTQRSATAFQHARRYGHPLGMIAIDLDHFKQINDRYGHAAGDEVLRVMVDCCHETLRGTDLLGRLGGEEFAVLLPDTLTDAAYAAAERLRLEIEAKQVVTPSGAIRFTASFGVSALADHGSIAEVLEEADRALYAAKLAGRNATVTA